MKNILILDTETTGIEPKKGEIIEIGAVLWNVEHRSIVEVYSGIMHADANPAEAANGIPSDLIRSCRPGSLVSARRVDEMAEQAECIVAHNAEFDRKAEASINQMYRVAGLEPPRTGCSRGCGCP